MPGSYIPTDASNGGDVVVGLEYELTINGFEPVEVFIFDVANNQVTPLTTFATAGFAAANASGFQPEVSHDGTVVSSSIGGVNVGSFDVETTGVWRQTAGQPIGTGTYTNVLEIDAPNPSIAYDFYVNNNSVVFPLGRGQGVSGDGNVVTGAYYRENIFNPPEPPIQQGGLMPLSFDLNTSTATPLSGNGPAIGLNGEALGADFDGNVVVGLYSNTVRPAIWRDGVLYAPGNPDNSSSNGGRAIAVSDDGNTVAGFQYQTTAGSNTYGQAVWHYDAGNDEYVRTNIGRLPGMTRGFAEATGITADGKVVVGWDLSLTLFQGGLPAGAGDTGQGTFWSEYTRLVNIEDFLDARGVDTSGFEIGQVTGISPDGTTLTARAFLGQGAGAVVDNSIGLVIDLTDTPLSPEPNQQLLATALANFGQTASYFGDTYFGDWTQDGLVNQNDIDFLRSVLLACDFDDNSLCNTADLNQMLAVGPVAPGVSAQGLELYDLTNDGVIDNTDVDEWLLIAAIENGLGTAYKRGDANLNGTVDGEDFILWNANKFSSSLQWNAGDFNGDGVVDGQDFLQWNANKFTSSNAVPEPRLAFAALVASLVLLRRRP